MIRINLIEKARNRRSSAPSALSLQWSQAEASSPALRVGLALVLLGLLWLGGHYFYLQYEATALQQRLARAQAENSHLQAVQRAYTLGVQRRTLLQKRLSIIGSLRDARSSPIALMLASGNAVNRVSGIWLTGLSQSTDGIQIKGDATSMDGVANLMTQLQKSGFFRNVELKSSTEKGGTRGPGAFQFQLVGHPGVSKQ